MNIALYIGCSRRITFLWLEHACSDRWMLLKMNVTMVGAWTGMDARVLSNDRTQGREAASHHALL